MPEPIRFYFDQHVPLAVAEGLRRRGIDVVTAQDAEMCGYADEEQLRLAVTQQRVLVTFDDDFLTLIASGLEHPGLAFCAASKYSIGELIRALLLLHDALTPEDMGNHIEFL
jgi:predicted nuclease of predicted toxin-antitoxin system